MTGDLVENNTIAAPNFEHIIPTLTEEKDVVPFRDPEVVGTVLRERDDVGVALFAHADRFDEVLRKHAADGLFLRKDSSQE